MSVKFAYFLVFAQLKIVWFIQWFAFKEIGIRIVYSIKLKHLILRTWCFQFHGWKSDLFTVNILWKECNNSSCDFFQSFELLLCIPLRFFFVNMEAIATENAGVLSFLCWTVSSFSYCIWPFLSVFFGSLAKMHCDQWYIPRER